MQRMTPDTSNKSTSNVDCALAQQNPAMLDTLNSLKKSCVSSDSVIGTNASVLFVLLNDDINQCATLTAANIPKTLKMTNKSEVSFVSEREKCHMKMMTNGKKCG